VLFNIVSSLSTTTEEWCITPEFNWVKINARMVIGPCWQYAFQKWRFDAEGKIRNAKFPDMCIEMKGKAVRLKDCVDGLITQQWHYTSRGKLFARNGKKGLVVDGNKAKDGAKVQIQMYMSNYQQGLVTADETWGLKFSSGILPVTTPETFRIVSDITTNNDEWCVFAKDNVIAQDGVKLSLSVCKTWTSFKWKMNTKGQLMNVKEPGQCIMRTRKSQDLVIKACNDSIDQRFAYGVLDKRLTPLTNGQTSMTVAATTGSFNTPVTLEDSDVTGPPYQKWRLETI
jgi:hypothetical protein